MCTVQPADHAHTCGTGSWTYSFPCLFPGFFSCIFVGLVGEKDDPSMADLLMFDFDGVIADSLEAFSAGFASVAVRHGLATLGERQAFLSLFDTNLYAGLHATGLPGERLRPFLDELGADLAVRVRDVAFFPGMADALNRLGRAHRVVIITSNLSAIVAEALTRHRVTAVERILGADVLPGKVEKIRAVMGQANGAIGCYIGDTRGDMLEGREAGARTVAVTWGWHARERLATAAPDHWADTPAELEKLFGCESAVSSASGSAESASV